MQLGERVLVGAGENDGSVRLASGEIVERFHRLRGDRVADSAHRERDERLVHMQARVFVAEMLDLEMLQRADVACVPLNGAARRRGCRRAP